MWLFQPIPDLVQGQVLLPGDAGQVLELRLLPPDAPALGGFPGHGAPGGVHGVLAAGQGIPPVPGLPEAQGGGVP